MAMQKHKKKISALPKTIAGFPVGDEGHDSERKSRGIALLISIFMTAMLILFMSDMIVNSTVEVKLAAANRDNLKAEYIAKSGLNLASFLVATDFAIDVTMHELQGEKYIPSDSGQDIWAMLNGFPLGGDTAELMESFRESFDLSKLSDDKVLSKLEQMDGQFTFVVQDEMSKINVNFCAVGQGIKCTSLLTALMSCPAEREFLERKKLNANEIVAHIRDWADTDSNAEAASGSGSESDPYADREPKVFPKNAFFDTVDELKMIPGWDDEIHQVFSPYLTVYPIPDQTAQQSEIYINFNSADRSLLACLLPKSAQECAEVGAGYFENFNKLVPPSRPEQISATLTQYFCENSKQVAKQFTYRSDIYRINVTATVGEQRRTLTAVIKRGPPDEMDRRDSINETIKFLEWKML